MFANKVLQTITNTGTGAYQLNSTGTGAWKTFRSQFATAAQVAYYAENADGTVWEFGYGTLTYGTPDQISRNYILSSTGSLIDWASADGTVYVMSVPMAQAMEGRWDSGGGFFVPAMKRPYTAVGAANKTVTVADAAGRFSFDTSAAARTVTLPTISAVPVGFNIEVVPLSSSYPAVLTPAGTNAIDSGAGGATLSVTAAVNIYSDGNQWRTSHLPNVASATAATAPRGHIGGLALSTAGSSATFSVAAGEATDKDKTGLMVLAATMSKTTSAWSAGTGNGSLDTGAIANSTWYHVHLIKNVSTGAVDVLISLSATAPTMPSGYTLSRRIGSLKTNGSAQWFPFVQDGDLFLWGGITQDVSANNPGTSAVTRTLNVPTGVNVVARILLSYTNVGSAGAGNAYVSDLATTDTGPSGSGGVAQTSWTAAVAGATNYSAGQVDVRTNTSAQIRSRVSYSDANVQLIITTVGWLDTRGRHA